MEDHVLRYITERKRGMKEKRVVQYTQNMEEIQRYRTIREPHKGAAGDL